MKRLRFLWLAAFFAGTARADDAPRELWLPRADIPAALKGHPRAVLLTREQYDSLERDARPLPSSNAEAPPAPVVLRSLTMQARAAGGIVIAEAEMSVDVLSKEPAALPLHFEPATLAALTLDNAGTLAAPSPESKSPAALLPPGRHTLKATLHYPVNVTAAGHTIAVRGTAAGASSFSLTLPATERVESALTWSSTVQNDSATHTFHVPAGEQPHAITWSRRDIRDLAGTAIMQSCDYRYTLDAVRLHAELDLRFFARLAALPQTFALPVPAEARVLSVEGADVLQWSAENGQLSATLTPQADRHEAGFTVTLDVPLAADGPAPRKPQSLTLPFPQAAGIHRASGRFTITTHEDLRVRRVTPPALAVQSEPVERPAGFTGLWEFAIITGAPRVEMEDRQPVFHATQDTQISLQRDAVHLLRHLKLTPRQGRLFQSRLAVPAGEEILSLTLADGTAADWHKLPPDAAGTPVEVRFPAGLKAGTEVALRLTTRRDPPQWSTLPDAGTDLSFARVTVTGADKLSGFIAVAAEDRFAVSTASVAGLEPRDPASLGDDVPVRGSLVWFAPGDFQLPLHVTPRAAEFDARVAAFAVPMQHGVEIEGTLALDIRQSGLRTLTVLLPPALAELWRCESPAIAGQTLDKASGAWRIAFRDELRGAQSLRWHLLLPVTEAKEARTFSATLPALNVTGARRTDFHWVMEANTDTELTFDTAGLDEGDTLTLPAVAGYAPRHRVIAAWSARGGDWKLALTARRHQTADLPALVVDRCDLTTSVSTGGALRHAAALTLRSNGRQFLDIPLPAGARILSLLVNGDPQKPAASGTAALRAQLPPGDAAVQISLTWEVQGEAWDSGGKRSIEPLRFAEDIPVIESAWTLRLPEGFVYSDFAGDLERVNGPPVPEFVLFPGIRKFRSATAAEPDFLPGGGGGTDGNERVAAVKMQILQSPAPDVFGTITTDFRQTVAANWLETQIKSITSPDNMLRVVKNLKLDEAWGMDPTAAAERLGSMTEVEQERGTEIVTIKVRSSDTAESANCARAIAEAYEQWRTEAEKDRITRLADTLQSQIKSQDEEVERTRQEMNDLAKKHSIVDMVPLSTGQGYSPVIQDGLSDAGHAQAYRNKLEEDTLRLRTQLQGIQNPNEEKLIAGASFEMGVQSEELQKLYPVYQSELAIRSSLLKSGFATKHPKIVALDESIQANRAKLEQAFKTHRDSLKMQLEQTEKLLADAKQRAADQPADEASARLDQNEYAAAKRKHEASLMLLNSVKEHAMQFKVDEGVTKKPVDILSAPAVTTKSVAGLLPMEIALPDEGEAFHFRGWHAPGAITFTARSLKAESRIAWLWIGAGVAAAFVMARRRTFFRGLLVALVLWLGPWAAGAGLGVCHRLLIGWAIGCGLLLVRNTLRRRTAMSSPLAAPVAAALAVLLLSPSPSQAEEAPAPRVLVPYDPAQPLAGQQPQQLYVDYAHFQKLWQQARDNRLARNAPPPSALAGAEAAILSALYDATLSAGVIKVEAALTIHTSSDWAVLGLRSDEKSAPFAGASIASLTLDEKAAVLHDGLLLIEKPGRHVLRASLQAPLAAEWRSFAMNLPAAPAALVSLAHADNSLRLRVNDGAPLEIAETPAPAFSWRGTAALGAAKQFTLHRLPAVTLAAGTEKPPLAAVSARLVVTPALERLDSRIDYAFAGAERRNFSFAFDAALTPVQVVVANLESWSVKDADGRRVLEFHLSVPARDGLTARFVAERAPSPNGEAPAVLPAANRQEYTLELLTTDDLELNVATTGGWARSELQGMGSAEETGFRKAGAWKLAGGWSPLTWTSVARAGKRSATADYAWKIAGGMIETTVTFTLRAAEHEDLSSLSIPLPAGAALQSLDGERLADWWRDGDTLELRFSGATAATTTFFLDFTQPLTDAHWQSGVPLPCVTIPGYEDVKGRAIAASGPETDLRLRLEDKSAREVEPAEARGDYRLLPPLLLRRGFTYEGATFKAAALLERVTPRFAVRWVLGAAVQDTWTESQCRADVEVKQGALPEVSFTLPAGMPEARVTGDVVRETVRTGDTYRVVFQSPVTTATALTIALELPHSAAIALPDVTFPAAELTERFLIMQNFSSGEVVPVTAASSGVEPLSREGMAELHFTVRGFTNPMSWRLKENWKLVAAHRALETTSGPQAVVLTAELTTMLRPQGPEWLRAVYRLQNRALQFLPLRLPDGMQLVSATVAGSPVRADKGTLPDGKTGLLIPLIQTRPGDLAMDVEIVCRSTGGSGARALEDPDIPGVSVQRTLWNVWTPAGWELSGEGGNMERADEQKTFLDKLEADFSELDSLSSVFSRAKSSKERNYSWSQSGEKIAELESKLKAKEMDAGRSYDDGEFRQVRERLNAAKVAQAGNAQQAQVVTGGTAEFANTDKWVWDSNSSYLQSRGKNLALTKNRELDAVEGLSLANGNLGVDNQSLKKLNFSTATPPPSQAPVQRRVNAQVETLNEEQAQQKEGKPSAKPVGKDDSAPVQKEDFKQVAQQSFNNVRAPARRQMLLPTPADEVTITGAAQVPQAATSGFQIPANAVQELLPAPSAAPQMRLSAALPSAPAEDAPVAPPMLKPAGRVSLPVTFPLDGTVHRFRKVNDGAALHLTLKPASRATGTRWLAACLLAGGLGVLWIVQRVRNRRQQAAA